jgi:uncharacterized membrane protein YgaE (UPF0421/DUF939 family)
LGCAEIKPPAREFCSARLQAGIVDTEPALRVIKNLRSIPLNNETLTQLKHAAKTGLAAVLAFYLARFLNLPESYWAAISAIIVMYSDVSRTMKASGQRLIGTAIGVSIGGIFAALFGQQLWALGVAVTITVFVCDLLGFADAARLAGVAVAIVIAVLVSALIWPTRSSKPT